MDTPKREREHAAIDARRVETRDRQPLRDDVPQNEQRPPSEQQAGGAAEQPEDRALGEELTGDPRAPGAERCADGQLTLTCGGSREQQVRDVGTRGQEDERDRGEQDQQRRLHVGGHLLLQRDDVGGPPGVEGRKATRQLGVNGGEILLCLGDRHAWLQPADHRQRPAAGSPARLGQAERGPHLDGALEVTEARRHDAHHRVRLSVKGDRARQDGRIAIPLTCPQTVADHGHPGPRHVVLRHQQTADQRLNPADRKELASDELAWYFDRLTGASEREVDRRRDRGQVRERVIQVSPVHEIAGGHRVRDAVAGKVALPHERQAIGIAIGQRFQQHSIDHAEDGGAGADANRECAGREQRKARCAHEKPHAMPQIPQ